MLDACRTCQQSQIVANAQVLWSLLFSVPVFFLAMVFSYIPHVKEGLSTNVAGFTANELVQWILTTPVQVGSSSQKWRAGVSPL